jgi:hypothetical protein
MPRFFARHRRLLALLLASTLIGAVCARLNTSGQLEAAAATTRVFIDDPGVSIVDRTALPQDLTNLKNYAELYGRLMTTSPVIEAIGRRARVPPDQISGVADFTADAPVQFTQAGSEEHASQLQASRAPYRLELQPDPNEPILNVYSEAPSVDGALRLANSAILGLQDYLRALAAQEGLPEQELPQLRQLGSARGGATNSSARLLIGGLTFITAFGLSFVGLFVLVRRLWRRDANEEVARPARRARLTGRAAADWPHTTRLLPWSIAGLITMFWLTPFDRIQLAGGSAPINITLDRVVLLVVAAIWLIAFAAGPGVAPRIRITRVHLAVGAYLAVAFVSVVLDAHYLNHTGELALGVKKAPLLVSYMAVFVLVASSVRRTEVPAFLTYTLVLAVIVGLEVIYEYHTGRDLFVTWSSKLFVSPFKLVLADPTNAPVVDSLGRRWVEGPTGYGVELVTMLSIALPIAVLGVLKSKTPAQYILYGLAIAVLLYAMVATDRKSALIAPAVVFLTLAYLRRRELLSMAPLGLVAVLVVLAVSPAALRNVVAQYTSANASHVATISARTANFDAVRPDLWTNLLFGRGQGTYAPPTDRIVDSDIILPLVETGVLGFAAFLMIPISVIVVARRTASRRDPMWSAPAVCGVAAAVCFIAVATLYSVMSLPHAPDVFLYVVGLVVVAVGAEAAPRGHPPQRGHQVRGHRTPPRRPLGAARRRAMPVG